MTAVQAHARPRTVGALIGHGREKPGCQHDGAGVTLVGLVGRWMGWCPSRPHLAMTNPLLMVGGAPAKHSARPGTTREHARCNDTFAPVGLPRLRGASAVSAHSPSAAGNIASAGELGHRFDLAAATALLVPVRHSRRFRYRGPAVPDPVVMSRAVAPAERRLRAVLHLADMLRPRPAVGAAGDLQCT